MSAIPDEDRALLERAIETIEASDRADMGDTAPFRSMLERALPLTPKQRAWAEGIAEGRFVEAEPDYQNLVSRGLVPRGREVEPPAVLRNLPLRPPTRR